MCRWPNRNQGRMRHRNHQPVRARPGLEWRFVRGVQSMLSGQYWNGSRCTPTDECADIIGRAGPLIAELRSIAARVREACSQDPSGDECMDLKQQQDAAVQRYRMLITEAPASCGANLPDPFSVI